MERALQTLRERWFQVGFHVFLVGGLIALAFVVVAPIPQVRAVAALATATAVTGVGVCVLGLQLVAPVRWRRMTDSMRSTMLLRTGARIGRKADAAPLRSAPESANDLTRAAAA